MKILGLIGVSLLITVGIYFVTTEIGDDEIFILPEGYTGAVFVLFNQENGNLKKFEGRKRTYEIPQEGVLRTQFNVNKGWHRPWQFFYRVGNQLVEIPYVIDGRDLQSGHAQVCCYSSGKAGTQETSVAFTQFFVGTKEEIHNAGEKAEKVNPADLVK